MRRLTENLSMRWDYTPENLRQQTRPAEKSRGEHVDAGILRDPEMGEPTSVQLQCRKADCKGQKLDTEPVYLSRTGEYLVPAKRCSKCKSGTQAWDPVDVPNGFVNGQTFRKWMKNPVKRWEYAPEDLRGPKPAPVEKPAAKKPAAKKRLLSSRDDDDDDDDDEDDEDEVPRKKARS